MSQESNTSSTKNVDLNVDLSFLITLVSGPFTLIMNRMQCYPELVKQKLESSSTPRSPLGMLKSLLKKQGGLALWKGNLPRIMHSVATANAMMPVAALVAGYNPFRYWTKQITLLAVASITYPLKFAELHLSNNAQPDFKTIRQSLKEGVAKGGIGNIYRGFLLHYIYCACLVPIGQRWHSWATDKMGSSQPALYAGSANLLAVETVNYGITTVWKRMVMSSLNERPYGSVEECVTSMYREGGIASFYRGYSIFFTCYAAAIVGVFALSYALMAYGPTRNMLKKNDEPE